MKIIKDLHDLENNKELIKSLQKNNYQQEYENLYSIHYSNKTAITFLEKNFLTTFVKKNDNIYECVLNIEPIISDSIDSDFYLEKFEVIYKELNHTLYFPLVYKNSLFYKVLNNKVYNYKRLYTSIVNYNILNNDIMNKVLSSNRVFFSMRNVKKFENNFFIKYYSKIDAQKILLEIERESWKFKYGQDMSTKTEQLKYYSELIKLGIATIAVAYYKVNNEISAYRIDTDFNDVVCVLKNSYKEKFKKYSLGSYMLIYDLYKHYSSSKYIDLYGGPGLVKEMIETDRVDRYDFLYGDKSNFICIEENRKEWDKKNYNNYIEGNTIKRVFKKKENILVATSCFGLGPVGKLNSIIETARDDFNWYASGEKFDFNILDSSSIFKDSCFSLNKETIKNFVKKYDIKYAIVVLKNKMAHILKELDIKVVYVDSLPFMWSDEDVREGKVPFEVDCYCAQKTLELSEKSNIIFSRVKSLHWVNPIVNLKKLTSVEKIKEKDYFLINLGGLHSPNTDGMDYIDVVIFPLLEILEYKKIYITTSTLSKEILTNKFKYFKNVEVVTLEQNNFLKYVKGSKLFFSSPGLTTIIESSIIKDDIIFLPPQNISQFYNIEYGKKMFKNYKEIKWNNEKLTLQGLKEYLNKNEKGVIQIINKEIKKMNSDEEKKTYKNYLTNILSQNNITNKLLVERTYDGANQIIYLLKKIIKEEKK